MNLSMLFKIMLLFSDWQL